MSILEFYLKINQLKLKNPSLKVIISINDPISSFRTLKSFHLSHIFKFIKSCTEFLFKYNIDGISNSFSLSYYSSLILYKTNTTFHFRYFTGIHKWCIDNKLQKIVHFNYQSKKNELLKLNRNSIRLNDNNYKNLKASLQKMNYMLTITIPPHNFVFENLLEMNLINKFEKFTDVVSFIINILIS